jgi:hypothetical protein
MEKDGQFLIYVNPRYYWSVDIVPSVNEADEPINRCALIDSETKEEVTAINFDATWLVPIFQTRSMIGMKELAEKLKNITDVFKIETTPSSQMPNDKKAKPIEKVVKKVVKGDSNGTASA